MTVTYNNSASLVRYFQGLVAQGATIAEVVIVDNGSDDDTVARIELARSELPFLVTLVESSNNGFSAGMNLAGASRTLHGFPLLCVNPDLELADGVVLELLQVLGQNLRVGIVTAPLIDESGALDSASVRSHPELGSAIAYSMAGRFLPARLRYNSAKSLSEVQIESRAGAFQIEATTGALMLLDPAFRATGEIFDSSYWMYGEDLQLCRDARTAGLSVMMANAEPSLHLKGLSSGRPRRLRSNWAFHQALFIYYRKNLSKVRSADPVVYGAVILRFLLSTLSSTLVRLSRALARQSLRSSPSPVNIV